jgi:integrase
MIDFPRPKTGIARRCPLWPQTVAAIREALAVRPEPRQEGAAALVFTTARGTPWVHFTATGGRIDNVTIQFTLLLRRLALYRPGTGFYALRHTHRTVADAACDPVACDIIMGHSDPSMAGHYRERVEVGRLRAVTEHVRQWLFGEAPDGGTADEPDGAASETGDPADALRRDEGDGRPALKLFAG